MIEFIDFKRTKEQTIVDIIEPLEIILTVDFCQHRKKSNCFRGIPLLYKFAYVRERSVCGSKLINEDDGDVVQVPVDCNLQECVRAKIAS